MPTEPAVPWPLGRGLAAAALAAALAWTPPAAAEEAPAAEEVIALTVEGEALMAAGDFDGAYARFAAANDATFLNDGFEPLVKHYPNLVLARYYRAIGDWPNCALFAASVASALDTEELGQHPYRTEALLLQGIAAFERGQVTQAEPPLRRAFATSEADPALSGLHALASYHLALLLGVLDSAEAQDYRDHFFALDLDGSPVTVEMTAYMVYQQAMRDRTLGADPAVLVEQMEYLMGVIRRLAGFNAQDLSFYEAGLGLFYAEAGQYDEALEIFAARHDHLLEHGPIDDDFYWNVQRRAMVTSILGDDAGAREFLQEQIAFGKAHGISPFLQAILYRDMGHFSANLGQTSVAQLHYRNAYSSIRSVLRANDPEVLAIKGLIDLKARDIKSFSFAPELGVVGDVDFELKPNAEDGLQLFFEGNYLVLDAVLDAKEAAGEGDGSAFLVNRALQQALTGEFTACLATLARARRAVLTDPAGPVRPGAAVIDLIEAIAWVWSTAHAPESARPLLESLGVRTATLPAGERSMYLALDLFLSFRIGQSAAIPEKFDAWVANWRAGGPRDIWGIAAATIALEAAFTEGKAELVAEVMQATLADIEAQGSMDLLRDYLRISDFLAGETAIFDEDALTELGVLLRDIALRVPEDHSMLSAAQYGMSLAMQWRGRLPEALEWLQQATATLRSNPWHAKDTLAYLISEMALNHAQTGNTALAASLAKEAYDMLDPMTARQDLAAAVIQTYAYTVRQRTNDAQRAAAIYRRHMEDPAFVARLDANQQVRLLMAYAEILSGTGEPEKVGELFDRAEVILDGLYRDTRRDRSTLMWYRAISAYFAQDYAAAFADIGASNDFARAWADERIAGGAAREITETDAHLRAIWEAAIGWEYAQTLPD